MCELRMVFVVSLLIRGAEATGICSGFEFISRTRQSSVGLFTAVAEAMLSTGMELLELLEVVEAFELVVESTETLELL